MKSISKIAAVLMAALLMSTCVFAVELAPDIGSRKVPTLVVRTDELGNTTGAIIRDPEDNHVTDVLDDEMILTPISEIEQAMEKIQEELKNAYGQLENADSIGDLGIDPDDHHDPVALEDVIVRNLVNVTLDDEHREYLEDDHSITLIFELEDGHENLIVLEHTCEDTWEIVPRENIFIDENHAMHITVGNVQHIAFVHTCGTEFTESVMQQSAPELVGLEDEFALIFDENGSIVYRVQEHEITITAVAERENASATIRDDLERAYTQIRAAQSISDFAPDAAAVLAQYDPKLSLENMVVRDLFDITLNDVAANWLNQDGHSIVLTFKLGLKPDDVLLVMTNHVGNQWKTVPRNDVVIHENGNVTVKFDALSPIAFVVESSALNVAEGAPDSPQTGMEAAASMMTAGIGAAGIGVVGVAVVGLLRKKFHK